MKEEGGRMKQFAVFSLKFSARPPHLAAATLKTKN
jgi:hypothetical protein